MEPLNPRSLLTYFNLSALVLVWISDGYTERTRNTCYSPQSQKVFQDKGQHFETPKPFLFLKSFICWAQSKTQKFSVYVDIKKGCLCNYLNE